MNETLEVTGRVCTNSSAVLSWHARLRSASRNRRAEIIKHQNPGPAVRLMRISRASALQTRSNPLQCSKSIPLNMAPRRTPRKEKGPLNYTAIGHEGRCVPIIHLLPTASMD